MCVWCDCDLVLLESCVFVCVYKDGRGHNSVATRVRVFVRDFDQFRFFVFIYIQLSFYTVVLVRHLSEVATVC